MPGSLPLDGVVVLDLTRLLPGNYCTWLLASLGADVIKIEDPGAGDYMRDFGAQVDGQGATHQLVNRAKRSVVIDLKADAGRRLFLQLVERADVVVDSFRPGVMERLDLAPTTLRAHRPSLVTAAISGFGESGPFASLAAHDLNYIALGGFLERLGHEGGRPPVPPIPVADVVGGGLVPALGIVALLMGARTTGVGVHLDASIAEGAALLPNLAVADVLAGAVTPGRGMTSYGGALACYDVYPVVDGFVAVGAVEAKFWRTLCQNLDVEELVEIQMDPDRQAHIRSVLGAVLAPLTRAEVEERLAGLDTCVTAVRSYEELLASDWARDRSLVRTSDQLPMPVLSPPFVLDGERPPEGRPAPRQGEHTADVLTEFGVRSDELDRLRGAGIVG